MKRILFIAPSSYPVNDAESIVNIKLLSELTKEKELLIDLVSRKRKWVGYPSKSLESYGVNLNSINIIEVDNKITIKTLFQTLLSLILWRCVFKGCHWSIAALPVVKELFNNNQYDYVVTKNEPSFLLGYYLRKRGLKWIASWNDPYPVSCYPEPYGKGYSQGATIMDKRIVKIMRCADKHIVPSIRLRNYMNDYLKESLSKFLICAHLVSDINTDIYNNDKKLRLISSGKLRPPRNIRPFLLGLKLFVEESGCRNIMMTIVGEIPDDIPFFIKENNLEDIVDIRPPVDYYSSLELLKKNHIGVIIEANCKNGIFLPTKVSDCMQCNTPIFAVSPIEGLLHDLFIDGNIPYFSETENEKDIAKTIGIIYDDFISNKISHNITPEEFKGRYAVELYNDL